ncbi:hypothetical protein H0O51_27350, partial [Escherichia coli]|nr:hypothetical protein [Escherichia coli]
VTLTASVAAKSSASLPLAVKVTQAGHQATIVSTDKGYCQLLSPTLRIRDYFQKRWLDAPFIDKEFGVQ